MALLANSPPRSPVFATSSDDIGSAFATEKAGSSSSQPKAATSAVVTTTKKTVASSLTSLRSTRRKVATLPLKWARETDVQRNVNIIYYFVLSI